VNAAPPAQARTSGKATAALVLGICGLVLFPPLGVIALFVGRGARNEIAEDPTLGGEALATAGIVLGWISVALIVVGILLLIAAVALVL
jgi:hypothetical protein